MCLLASGACVRRARAPHLSHTETNQTKKMPPRQPVPAPQKPVEKCRKTRYVRRFPAAALAQEKPPTRSQTCPPCPPTAKTYSQGAVFEGFERCRGCRGCKGCKGCWNAQMLVMQGTPGMLGNVCDDVHDVFRECWRLSGAICMAFTVFLKVGKRGIRSPSQGQGGRGCFGVQAFGPACVQVMQAMLRRSLGCNNTRQRYPNYG